MGGPFVIYQNIWHRMFRIIKLNLIAEGVAAAY